MSVSRLPRMAEAARTISVSLFLIPAIVVALVVAGAPRASAADAVTGTVVDQNGRPLPRASVRVLDRTGAETAGVFADESGRFRIAIPAAGASDCRITVSLTGFQPSNDSCAASRAGADRPQRRADRRNRRRHRDANRGAGGTGRFERDGLYEPTTSSAARSLKSPSCCGARPARWWCARAARGGVTSLFVRGGESSYNKVLLDGIPLNEPGGTFNFSNVTSEGLERIEIVRGAQSALFGSDAMSSVVQMFTKRGDRRNGRPHVSAALEGGTYGTRARRPAGVGRLRPRRLRVRRRKLDHRQPRAQQHVRQHDAARQRRRLAQRHGHASCRRPRRAPTQRHPGSDGVRAPRSRCVFQAARRRRRRQLRPAADVARSAAGGVLAERVESAIDEPHPRRALHAGIRGAAGAVSVFGFQIRQPEQAAPPPRQLPGGLAPHERLGSRQSAADAAGGLGRRARRPSRIAWRAPKPVRRATTSAGRFSTRRRGGGRSSLSAAASSTTKASGPPPSLADRSPWSSTRAQGASAKRPFTPTRGSASRNRRCFSRSACRRSSTATRTSSRSVRARLKPGSSSVSGTTASRSTSSGSTTASRTSSVCARRTRRRSPRRTSTSA